MSIDVSVVLPRLQFLHKCAGFVFSADDGFLEGLDDGRDFMLLMSFLGEDDRIGDLQNTLLGGGHSSRLSGGRSGLDVLGLAGTDNGGEVFASCVDIELGGVVVVFVNINYSPLNFQAHMLSNKKHGIAGQTAKSANL